MQEFELSQGIVAMGAYQDLPLVARPHQQRLVQLERRGTTSTFNLSHEEVRRLYHLVEGLEEDAVIEAACRQTRKERAQ